MDMDSVKGSYTHTHAPKNHPVPGHNPKKATSTSSNVPLPRNVPPAHSTSSAKHSYTHILSSHLTFFKNIFNLLFDSKPPGKREGELSTPLTVDEWKSLNKCHLGKMYVRKLINELDPTKFITQKQFDNLVDYFSKSPENYEKLIKNQFSLNLFITIASSSENKKDSEKLKKLAEDIQKALNSDASEIAIFKEMVFPTGTIIDTRREVMKLLPSEVKNDHSFMEFISKGNNLFYVAQYLDAKKGFTQAINSNTDLNRLNYSSKILKPDFEGLLPSDYRELSDDEKQNSKIPEEDKSKFFFTVLGYFRYAKNSLKKNIFDPKVLNLLEKEGILESFNIQDTKNKSFDEIKHSLIAMHTKNSTIEILQNEFAIKHQKIGNRFLELSKFVKNKKIDFTTKMEKIIHFEFLLKSLGDDKISKILKEMSEYMKKDLIVKSLSSLKSTIFDDLKGEEIVEFLSDPVNFEYCKYILELDSLISTSKGKETMKNLLDMQTKLDHLKQLGSTIERNKKMKNPPNSNESLDDLIQELKDIVSDMESDINDKYSKWEKSFEKNE